MTFLFILLPIRKAQEARAKRDFEEAFKYIKLRALKRHYHALQDLTLREIEDQYNIDKIYFDM